MRRVSGLDVPLEVPASHKNLTAEIAPENSNNDQSKQKSCRVMCVCVCMKERGYRVISVYVGGYYRV